MHMLGTSGQDGGVGRHTAQPPRPTKRRTITNLKTKKQPELTEKQTLWKSDNQGYKEETFIQTSSKGRDRQPGRKDSGKAANCRLGAPTFAFI